MKKRWLFPSFLIIVVLTEFIIWQWIPIQGNLIVLNQRQYAEQSLFPDVQLTKDKGILGGSASVFLTDTTPRVYLELLVNGQRAQFVEWQKTPGSDLWTWQWRLPNGIQIEQQSIRFLFYHSCHIGCVEWFNKEITNEKGGNTNKFKFLTRPSKLGVVFAMPSRDWHGVSGWNVELTYALSSEKDYWHIDHVAARIVQSCQQKLQVLLRADYDRGQTLPPKADFAALESYLNFVRRLANDARFRCVHGLIIGSGPNDNGSNSKAPERKITPEWYAQILNGYGNDPNDKNNVVEIIRAVNPSLRVLVGPIRPWNSDQNGLQRFEIDVPWLNYMNTLVSALDQTAQNKAKIGKVFAVPDGFAIQAPGRPDAAELQLMHRSLEPKVDLRRSEWNGAQAGFRVYQDWLHIINAYSSTRGLPVYISSTNTYTPDAAKTPSENYPQGWLTNAMMEINQVSQIKALCWFIDGLSSDEQWDGFSLNKRVGLLSDTSNEFEYLLRDTP